MERVLMASLKRSYCSESFVFFRQQSLFFPLFPMHSLSQKHMTNLIASSSSSVCSDHPFVNLGRGNKIRIRYLMELFPSVMTRGSAGPSFRNKHRLNTNESASACLGSYVRFIKSNYCYFTLAF